MLDNPAERGEALARPGHKASADDGLRCRPSACEAEDLTVAVLCKMSPAVTSVGQCKNGMSPTTTVSWSTPTSSSSYQHQQHAGSSDHHQLSAAGSSTSSSMYQQHAGSSSRRHYPPGSSSSSCHPDNNATPATDRPENNTSPTTDQPDNNASPTTDQPVNNTSPTTDQLSHFSSASDTHPGGCDLGSSAASSYTSFSRLEISPAVNYPPKGGNSAGVKSATS